MTDRAKKITELNSLTANTLAANDLFVVVDTSSSETKKVTADGILGYFLDGATIGSQGPQGVTGTTGPAGPQGAQGFQGTTGATGSTGSTGAQGFQGFDGAQGNQGYQGAQGFQGSIGAQGTIGATGASGSLGAQGFQGTAGLSAVDYIATSTDAITLEDGGSFIITVSDSDSGFQPGQTVILYNSENTYLIATVDSYSNGLLQITKIKAYGTGEYSSWSIYLGGVDDSYKDSPVKDLNPTPGSANTYMLQLSDRGKTLWAELNDALTIEIPRDSDVVFPLGTTIKIAVGSVSGYLNIAPRDYGPFEPGDDETIAEAWYVNAEAINVGTPEATFGGVQFSTLTLPTYTMATLTKVQPNKWFVECSPPVGLL